jgi:hypothetical protein
MAAMGGWGILDYALNFAAKPHDWLQLGYASYLSSWCLMNTGPPESNYGFGFRERRTTARRAGNSCPRSLAARGWARACRVDRGLTTARSILATARVANGRHDSDARSVFDWFAYGGKLTLSADKLSVVPRDGLRQRFFVVTDDAKGANASIRRLKIELDRDGFAAGESIVTDKSLKSIAFTLENRTGDEHATGLWLSLPPGTTYEVFQNGQKLRQTTTGNWDYPLRVELKVTGGTSRIEIKSG